MTQDLGDTIYMRLRLSFLALSICLSSADAFAGERYEFYNGVRMLGMGGAGVATVNDETALLVNPAGLGKLRDHFLTVIDPEVAISSETEEIAGKDLYKVTEPQDALNFANVNPDRHLHSRGQIFPSFVIPNFGIGLYGRYEVDSEFVSETNKFKYHYTADWAGVLGANLRLLGGIVKLGANARVTNRTQILRDDIDPASTDLNFKTLASSGLGVASDIGLLATAPISWLPTFGAVYRDIGRTTYSAGDGMFMKTEDRPASTLGTLDLALAIQPIVGRRVRSTWTVEYQDLLTVGDEDDQMRRLHAGMELNFADAFFLRAGMNQRYWTAGFELSMLNYQFQVASYGEDIGTADLPREDRRYVLKFAFRF